MALTVAGSDPSGGAGVQADLKTFAALEVYGASAITALTAQNTAGVRWVHPVEPELVASQMDAVLDDLPVTVVKIGMLANADIVNVVAVELTKCSAPVVLDTVLASTSGAPLLDDAGQRALVERLLPRAALVTPNLVEAERLCGFSVRTVEDMERAARELVALGARAALVKGGHLAGDPVDVLLVPSESGGTLSRLSGPRIDTTSTHGTGCTYASAIAAHLAKGAPLVDAVTRAHAFVRAAIERAPKLGRGRGPLHHLHAWYRWPTTRSA